MKKVFASMLVFVIISVILTAYAVDFTYDQIIDIIDAVSVDGVKMFSDSSDGTVSPDEREDFFTQSGIALVWMGDNNTGILFFFDNDSTKMHLWNKIDINNIRNSFDILLPVLDPYIDYNKGGKATLILTNRQTFTKPFAKVEYSPNIQEANKTDSATYNEYYDDIDNFKNAVERWFRIALDGESVETDNQLRSSSDNAFEMTIIPNTSIWGISADSLKETYKADYEQCQVDEDDALRISSVEVCNYNMDVYYVFDRDGNAGLSKIAYILNDNDNYTGAEQDQCLDKLIQEMKKVVGEPDSVKKGTSIWKNKTYRIELGKGKLSKYTGSNNPTVAIIFKAVAESSSVSSTNSYEKLTTGSSGDEVINLQNRLNELGYSVGTADGSYGSKTKTAIEKFQTINSLSANGIADDRTQKRIYSKKAVCNLETISGLSITEALKSLISSAPVTNKKSCYTYENYSDISKFISAMGINDPNNIVISNWKIVDNLEKDTITISDEKNTYILKLGRRANRRK